MIGQIRNPIVDENYKEVVCRSYSDLRGVILTILSFLDSLISIDVMISESTFWGSISVIETPGHVFRFFINGDVLIITLSDFVRWFCQDVRDLGIALKLRFCRPALVLDVFYHRIKSAYICLRILIKDYLHKNAKNS